ncbi:thioesterase-like superfamily-domain-containing protein [Macrophomina phaseolina]|uniref:Thioesterase-like superfamily-domain-containing protein n=1 Tax=Macrophomina phaseolina TaxID=35725 RepID=A0ABQ8GKB2_9PEZI|nr:thioesterase-like superfamily-domain-containing protein [Macrophomina phaseolina]
MSTLIKPPPIDPSISAIEQLLDLTQLTPIDPDLFTNTQPLWHPPGARGIYGGAIIAQCLAAAQRTIPDDFNIHSMHCYFVLAGDSEIPVIYHVEHVREGRSFATRTVQARQRGKVIFTTTLSFVKSNSAGKRTVEHAYAMPDVPGPRDEEMPRFPQGEDGPFESQRLDIDNNESPYPHMKKCRQWIRARGTISPAGGHHAHLSALAYMSDSYFIGTVARVHKVWAFRPRRGGKPTIDEERLKKLLDEDEEKLRRIPGMDDHVINSLREGKTLNEAEDERPEIGMMVSLDHTIYFHNPREFRADEWMFSEMESPWAGDGRGLVFSRIFTRDGKLIATCVQEGVVRLKQPSQSKL